MYGDRPFVIISAQAPDVEGLDRHDNVQVHVRVNRMLVIVRFGEDVIKWAKQVISIKSLKLK